MFGVENQLKELEISVKLRKITHTKQGNCASYSLALPNTDVWLDQINANSMIELSKIVCEKTLNPNQQNNKSRLKRLN